ncbi:MAG: hypothetical protein M1825_004784 [Sarcosagium campestre]|nr:MAG: hypothetical protein M1825_004784 [Sarcosagium campestre]
MTKSTLALPTPQAEGNAGLPNILGSLQSGGIPSNPVVAGGTENSNSPLSEAIFNIADALSGIQSGSMSNSPGLPQGQGIPNSPLLNPNKPDVKGQPASRKFKRNLGRRQDSPQIETVVAQQQQQADQQASTVIAQQEKDAAQQGTREQLQTLGSDASTQAVSDVANTNQNSLQGAGQQFQQEAPGSKTSFALRSIVPRQIGAGNIAPLQGITAEAIQAIQQQSQEPPTAAEQKDAAARANAQANAAALSIIK